MRRVRDRLKSDRPALTHIHVHSRTISTSISPRGKNPPKKE